MTFFEDIGNSNQPLSHESASKYFTIGLVRKPCDWMLSAFIQEKGKKYEHLAIPTDESRASFKAWVSRSAFARSSMHMSCSRPRAGPRLITRALTGGGHTLTSPLSAHRRPCTLTSPLPARARVRSQVNESITVRYPALGKLSLSHGVNAKKMKKAKKSHVLSAATITRYGELEQKLVHCMMHLDTVKAAFVRCAKEYQACGGPAGADLTVSVGQYAFCHARTLILLRPFCYLRPYSATNSASRISRIGNLYRAEVS